MTTATEPRKPRASNPREAKPLEPVVPAVLLTEYDQETGTGLLTIDGQSYVLVRFRAEGKTVGMRLMKYDAKTEKVKMVDVDFRVKPWACDCEDATYRSERPGGCKHVVALRMVAKQMKCRRTD